MHAKQPPPSEYPVLFFTDQAAWHVWLAANHTTAPGVWIKYAKKGSGVVSVNYTEAVDEALCYGWIDGQAKSIDDTYYMQKYTPRRPKSIWSKINIGKTERLIAEGRMQPAGQAAIEAAKADGRWEQAYDSPSTTVVPDDFKAALDADPQAKAFFGTLNKTNTYAVLWRVQTARKPETRAARIVKLVAMLHRGEKLH
jgi:uncharacterized protein YdeI (YjbR/CyaY-like superfamily)